MNYNWSLENKIFKRDKGKVFSCFSGGGGSSMGYLLDGFDVIGSLELDKKLFQIYKENINSKYSFLEDIRDFKERDDLPAELYELDILDGSPPCSTFSMAGRREETWGVEKRFREGQKKQVLDTLFFDFIDLAKKLQPKVVISENVKGIILGKAKKYTERIIEEFKEAGYITQYYLVKGMYMGIPQKRERVFFISIRQDLWKEEYRNLDMTFNEPPILFSQIYEKDGTFVKGIPKSYADAWEKRKYGDKDMSYTMDREFGRKNTYFNMNYIYMDKVPNTLTANHYCAILFDECRTYNLEELLRMSTFPSDYNFGKVNPWYVMGMAVPPLMTAKVVGRVREFTKLFNE